MEKQKVTLQTVDRALELIDLMAATGYGMSVQEISKALDVTRTGAYNLLNSLMARNYVEKDTITNKYHIGYRLLELGESYIYRYPFVPIAEREIYKLCRKWPYEINLGVYKPLGKIVYLGGKRDDYLQRGRTKVVIPAHTKAEGKLLMAYLSEQERLETVKGMELKQYARKTITDQEVLMAQLKEIRERGYAEEYEENKNNVVGIACPIFSVSGEVVAAVGIEMPMDHVEDHIKECLEDLQNTCKDISMQLGYNPYLR